MVVLYFSLVKQLYFSLVIFSKDAFRLLASNKGGVQITFIAGSVFTVEKTLLHIFSRTVAPTFA